MTASSYNTLVQELYVSYFGRPADAGGLGNFAAALAAAGAPTTIAGLNAAYTTDAAIRNLIDSFGNSAESTALYGTVSAGTASADAFVTAVFEHVLNRAPASSGLNFWANSILSGSLSLGDAALAIAAGAQANTSAQGLVDASTVNNKLAVASQFTTAVSNTSGIAEYTGPAAAGVARNLLSGVVGTTTAAAYQPALQSALTSLSTAANTFTLTTGVDQLVGKNGNNVFNAVLDNTVGVAVGGAAATLNANDIINGGPVSNVLNIVDYGLASNIVIPSTAQISHITTLNINSSEAVSGTGSGTLDFSGWAGLSTLNVVNSTGNDVLTAPSQTILTVSNQDGSITTHGGMNVTASADAGHDITIYGGSATVSVTITGGGAGGNIISDLNFSTGRAADTIASVSITNGAENTINSDALTSLYLTGSDVSATVNAAAGTRVLTVALNSDSGGSISDATATAFYIANSSAHSNNVTLIANAATAINFADAADLSLTNIVAPVVSSIGISGAGAFSADFSQLSGLTKVDATNSSGTVTVTLDGNTSFSGGTGQDVVTLDALPASTVAINGSANASNEIILNNITNVGYNTSSDINGFSTLVLAGTTYGMFNLAADPYSAVDIQGSLVASGQIEIMGIGGVKVAIDNTEVNSIRLDALDYAFDTDIVYLTIGGYKSAGISVAQIYAEDNEGVPLAQMQITSNSANGAVNTIGTLCDSVLQSCGLTNLSLMGNAPVYITDILKDISLSQSLIINNNAGTTASTIVGLLMITQSSACSLGFTGTESVDLSILIGVGPTWDISNSGNASVTIGDMHDANLATLTLEGNVAIAIGSVNDQVTITSQISVQGATDNAAVTFIASGATASGITDTITLGSGIDTVVLGAGVAGSSQIISLGSGAGDSVSTSSSGNVDVTIASRSLSGSLPADHISVTGANAIVQIHAGDGVNNITVSGNDTNVGIVVGAGQNTITVGNGASGSITFQSHTGLNMGNYIDGETISIGTLAPTGETPNLNNIISVSGLNNATGDAIIFSDAASVAAGGMQQVVSSQVSGDSTVLSNWIAAAVGQGGNVAQTAHGINWFQFGGNTYLVETATANDAGTVAAGDTVVKLVGTGYTFAHSVTSAGVLHLAG